MCSIRLLLLINMRVPCEGDINLSEVKEVELRDMNTVITVIHILTTFQRTVKGKEFHPAGTSMDSDKCDSIKRF